MAEGASNLVVLIDDKEDAGITEIDKNSEDGVQPYVGLHSLVSHEMMTSASTMEVHRYRLFALIVLLRNGKKRTHILNDTRSNGKYWL